MGFTLRSDGPVKYSAREQSIFALLPKDGTLITSAYISRRHYGKREKSVYNARKIIIGLIASLIRKIEFNKEPFRIKKSHRTGPIPMKFWLEKRK